MSSLGTNSAWSRPFCQFWTIFGPNPRMPTSKIRFRRFWEPNFDAFWPFLALFGDFVVPRHYFGLMTTIFGDFGQIGVFRLLKSSLFSRPSALIRHRLFNFPENVEISRFYPYGGTAELDQFWVIFGDFGHFCRHSALIWLCLDDFLVLVFDRFWPVLDRFWTHFWTDFGSF